jgi:prolyl 4-hydroxylase
MNETRTFDFAEDQPALRKLGNKVRARLDANGKAWKVPTDQAEIWAVADFITPSECERLIEMVDAVARPSTVFDSSYESGFRTSYSGDVDPHNPFIRKLSRRVDDLLGLDPKLGETMQGQRYMPGQQFKPHQDWFHPGTSYWDLEMARGGQRSFTAMAFLNEVEEGGTTDFTDIGISIEPKPGVLLVWNNADPDGVPNLKTIHAGMPVVKGAKYIFTKWYRTRRWH